MTGNLIEFTIPSEPPSLKNLLRFNGRTGRTYHADDAVRTYKELFALLCPKQFKQNIEKPVCVSLHIYKKDNRKDATNISDTIWDCLQYCGVIKNDRLIEEWHCFSFIDKKNPRVVVKVEERRI